MTLVELAYKLRPYIEMAAQSLDDTDALDAVQLYPNWKNLCAESYFAETAGYKFQHEGLLYKTVQNKFTFQSQWIPGVGTESIYTRIDETHTGTISDPIPYDGNMELFNGLYYTQDDVLYLCIRDTGTAVYHPLSALVGLYVEVVSD